MKKFHVKFPLTLKNASFPEEIYEMFEAYKIKKVKNEIIFK